MVILVELQHKRKKIYRGLLVGTNEFKKRVKKIEQNFFVDKKKKVSHYA